MFRAIFPRVMWVGRAAVFTVGLAVILAVVFGVASMAFAANGDSWILGQSNAATAITRLGGAVGVNGPMLQVINNDADTNDTALSLVVDDGEPPMKVTSDTRVVNLNSDKLDNRDSAAFLPSEIYEKSVMQTLSAGSVDNGITLYCDPGDVAVSGSYRILQPGAYLKVFGEERVDDRFDEETGETNPSGWHVYVDNPDATTSGSIKVFVYCADRPPLHVPPGP
jgi:hypothetical protein